MLTIYFFNSKIERAIRASGGDQATIVLDMYNSSLKNLDMEYTQYMINTLKSYYPNSVNYILVYDAAWIMNGMYWRFSALDSR